jgi:hypothetical protein
MTMGFRALVGMGVPVFLVLGREDASGGKWVVTRLMLVEPVSNRWSLR